MLVDFPNRLDEHEHDLCTNLTQKRRTVHFSLSTTLYYYPGVLEDKVTSSWYTYVLPKRRDPHPPIILRYHTLYGNSYASSSMVSLAFNAPSLRLRLMMHCIQSIFVGDVSLGEGHVCVRRNELRGKDNNDWEFRSLIWTNDTQNHLVPPKDAYLLIHEIFIPASVHQLFLNIRHFIWPSLYLFAVDDLVAQLSTVDASRFLIQFLVFAILLALVYYHDRLIGPLGGDDVPGAAEA